MIARAAIVAEARSWIGTPWIHQASLKGVGSDCVGFVAGVALAVGVPGVEAFASDVRFMGYGRDPNLAQMEEGCAAYLIPIRRAELKPGDLLRIKFGGDPKHFAIVTELEPRFLMIHAYAIAAANLSRVVEHGCVGEWLERIEACYRFPGVED